MLWCSSVFLFLSVLACLRRSTAGDDNIQGCPSIRFCFSADHKVRYKWTTEETREPHTLIALGFSLSSSWDTSRYRIISLRLNKHICMCIHSWKLYLCFACIEGLINIWDAGYLNICSGHNCMQSNTTAGQLIEIAKSDPMSSWSSRFSVFLRLCPNDEGMRHRWFWLRTM